MTNELPQDRKIPSGPNEALPLADGGTTLPNARSRDDRDRHHGSRDGTLLPRAPEGAHSYAQGSVIKGRWEVLDQLGQGSGGRVFRASDRQQRDLMEVHRALKLISGPAADLDRVRKEISAGDFAHQNLVRTIDFGYTDDARTCFFIVMDLFSGGTLADLIRHENGRVDGNRARRLCHGILHGLDALHRRNLVHRDLKPTNILIDVADGTAERPLLSDFGISHTAEGGQTNLQGAGTFGYAAPEQLKGRATYASDIYAFGRIVFELLVGRLPDYGDPPLERLRPELPATVGKLVVACMANDPAKRPQSAKELMSIFDEGWPIVVQATSASNTMRSSAEPTKSVRHNQSAGIKARVATAARNRKSASWRPDWAFQATQEAVTQRDNARNQAETPEVELARNQAMAECGDAEAMFYLGQLYERGRRESPFRPGVFGVIDQNHVEAARWYRSGAEAGNTNAMINLGLMYANGRGVDQSDVEAVRWFRSGAEAGNANAMTNLGVMYANGSGVEQSDVEAVRWFRASAETGNADAMFELGTMYTNGRGVDQSDVEAVRWFRSGAEAGNTNAMINLGMMYANGRGVDQSDVEAVRWYRAGAEAGNTNAMINLGVMYANGRGVDQSDVAAARWYRAGAEAGNTNAMINLGAMYANGRGVDQSDVKAVRWYRAGAEAGNTSGMYNLGVTYANGGGVGQSDIEAVRWYWAGAEAGNANAMLNLGMMYANGRGVDQSNAKAVRWYRSGAEAGNANAMFNLGVMYANGRGVEQSDVEAIRWYRASAEAGNADAMYNLGLMYANGRGVDRSDVEAVRWYRAGAEGGNTGAMYSLGWMYGNGRGVDRSDVEAVRWNRAAAEAGNTSGMYNLGVMCATGRGVEQSDVEAIRWWRAAAALGHAKARQWLKSKGVSEIE